MQGEVEKKKCSQFNLDAVEEVISLGEMHWAALSASAHTNQTSRGAVIFKK